jgi:hypothetical protein
VRITGADMGAVPLPAAWVYADDSVVVATPEWSGPGLGVREYRAGRLRLLVSPTAPAPGIRSLSERLLKELDQAVPETDPRRQAGLRLAVAALGVAVGRGDPQTLTERQIAEAVVAACALEDRAPAVHIEAATGAEVRSGWLVAAALKQIVMNARKHEGCEEVRLCLGDGWSAVSWHGEGALRPVATSRHPDRRSGWGLGMVRLCCDAIGASYLAPREAGKGWVEAAFVVEPESTCLRLPMAVVDADSMVTQATRTWDAEAGVFPGRPLRDADLLRLARTAQAVGGRIAESGPWAARCHGGAVWLALRPADTREQGLDLLDGIAHEAQLLVGEPGSHGWRRAVAVLEALEMALGQPVAAYGEAEFARDLPLYGEAFGRDLGPFEGVTAPAPPPALTAFLLAAGGGGRLVRDDRGWVVRPRDPAAAELAGLVASDGSIRVDVGQETKMQEVTR